MFCKDCKYWKSTDDKCYGMCCLSEYEKDVISNSYIVFMYDGCSYWRKNDKRKEVVLS